MNEREQLAKDNGMTIEFVNWFFDNKKDGCGNAWFIMMAAMWEGWKVQESRCSWLAAERDALREGEMGDARHSNTRAAADIYFQLVEECEIPAGGSLVEYVDNMRDELEDYKAAYEEYARDKEVQRAVIDDALCKLLPGTQYMDPPDGGSVTPLEQVRRMVADYRQRIAELEAREVRLPERYSMLHRADFDEPYHTEMVYKQHQVIESLVAAGIITKVGE